MAQALSSTEKPKGGGIAGLLALIVVLAGAGGGGGFFLVRHAMDVARTEAKTQSEEAKKTVPEAYAGTRHALALPPVITNMASSGTWVRLEASLVYDEAGGKLPQTLAAEISEDMLAYLRSLTVGHIAGPSGFLHLKADLTERAKLRSEGRVEDILIQSLVFE
ncbi:MAG: flagellar basal body-associated FliL family protein [Phyllobacteriaceae bacterium]|nr:flagellar basal body-associated FliL family protein [Phyllobacteriaceae bacterium]